MKTDTLPVRSSVLLLAGWLLLAPPLSATTRQPRPLQVDDLFEIEGLARNFGGAVTTSPDGQSVAFIWDRASKSQSSYSYMTGAGKDVWVQPMAGAKAIDITQGTKDGTSWWGGVWSADGKRLALLSTRGNQGGEVLMRDSVVWVWDRKSTQLQQISTRKVNAVGRLTRASAGRMMTWLDHRHLLVSLRPSESPSPWSQLGPDQKIILDQWLENAQGRKTTANVLDSGIPRNTTEQPHSQLMLLDTDSGASRVIVDEEAHGWTVAPGGKALAYYRQIGTYAPVAGRKIGIDEKPARYSLQIVDLQGTPLFTGESAFADVAFETLRWSDDGNAFAFVATGQPGKAARVFRGSVATGRIEALRSDSLDVLPPAGKTYGQVEMRWPATGELWVRASHATPTDQASGDRHDWWAIGVDAPPRCLTQAMPEVPAELWPEAGRSSFFGLAAGAIWRVASSGQAHNLTANLGRKIDALAWPQTSHKGTTEMSRPEDRAYSRIVLAAREPQQPLDHYVFDLESGAVAPLAKPDADAQLASFNAAGDAAVFYATSRQGSRLWRTAMSSGQSQVLVDANAFLQVIAESEFRLIEYRSLKGQTLKGWILLPIGYREGRRYPLLTWVYPGTVIPPTANQPSPLHRIGDTGVFNMQLAAARGFAVLLPSMPLEPNGSADDPLLRLTDGVLPAVDKAIELGIADPDRLFVAGHSFGGYATFGLVTQTHRFKAAIAHAGTANLVNTYGTLSNRTRYSDPYQLTLNITWAEAGQGRMGSPPWVDQERYIRNSPITYVDRVSTPLLIVHGDMDVLGMEDPENFFRSLYRQGKRAQFVRYPGEGHLLSNPANIRDMWQRMIGWMDEYGDIERDPQGDMVFENDRAKGRDSSK